MSDYTKLVNFASKDSLPIGTPAKIVSGTEINDELVAVATAVASKADKVTGATNGNLASLDTNGNLVDSGISVGTGTGPVTTFAAGTRMLFNNPTAPLGWTQVTDAAYNNAGLRIRTDSTVSTGGTIGFTSVFGITSTDAHTLTAGEIPAHDHGSVADHNHDPIPAHTHTINHGHSASSSNGGNHTHSILQYQGGSSGRHEISVSDGSGSIANPTSVYDQSASNGQDWLSTHSGHTHPITVNSHSGSSGSAGGHTLANDGGHTHDSFGGSGSHSHGIDLNLKYADFILCQKA